ncbi:MAG: efflux RND transporter permease subunit [Lachnospiraceae bacterium]|nr:efflux RND transporter permease subunit [Lachnospiraceae bacterium]
MISKFSVKKPYTVLVGVVLAIVLGVVSFTHMTADLLPSISLPYVIVMTTYIGASPETVETVVTRPIEASMATVSNIESVSSVSSENYSMVILEFAQTANMDSISLEIRENLDQLTAYWDDDLIGNPIIMKLNPDMLPIMIAAAGVEGMDIVDVSAYIEENIVPELESIEGVASVSTTGMIEESVNVVIRQDKIDLVNADIRASIDVQMDEAKQELIDGREEIQDGLAQIADGKHELANGQTELNNGKTELENGKIELENQQNDTMNQLAEAQTQLLTAKADLETLKTTTMADIAVLEQLTSGLKKLQDTKSQTRAQFVSMIQGLQAQYMQIPGSVEPPMSREMLIGIFRDKMLETLPQYGIAQPYIDKLSDPDLDWDNDFGEDVTTAGSDTVCGILYEYADSVNAQFDVKIDELQNSINARTLTLPPDEYIKTLYSQLNTYNSQIAQIDTALTELASGESAAILGFANGMTQITLSESELASAQAELDAAKAQLESTQEQLQDALLQLEEGEEQLEEARIQAYEQADMMEVLTVDTVSALLMAQNFSMPAGYVTEEGISYMVRIGDKPENAEELGQLPLLNLHMDGVDIITLADVADVFYADNSDEVYSNVNGSVGVMLTVQKQTGYSTGAVSDLLAERFAELEENHPGLTMITLMDQGIYIDLVMDSIINNIVFGALLAILVLLLFLKDLRPTLVVAFSIPISLVTAIVCMYFSGVTLNVISLSGLALGIGMLVDNSIVVIENIYRLRNEGKSVTEAATEGAREVGGAIMASTLTTICVFAPIVFTEGITRQLFVDMGLTIAYSLLASLLIALTVVPAMASGMLKRTKEKKEGKFFTLFVKGYEKVLRLSLRFKPIVLILVVALLFLSAAAAISNGTAFMADMDSTQLTVNVWLGEEATLAETGAVTDEVVSRIRELPDISDVGAMAGGSTMSMLTGSGGSTNSTTIYVVTVEDKSMTNEEIAQVILEKTADLEAEISVDTSSMDMSALGGSGIAIRVEGRDLDTLQQIAAEVAEIVEGVEGTTEVSDGMEDADEELRITVNKDAAMEYGLTVAQVFAQVSARLAESASATTLEESDKDYGVYVISEADKALTRELLKSMMIDGTGEGNATAEVALSEIADFEMVQSLSSINRSEQTRYITVSAGIAEGYNIGQVSTQVERALSGYQLPGGYRLVYAGENETINDAMEQVGLMLLLALVFMYLIMVAQFQSLLSPFIIMFTIPLAFTGGLFGLFFTGSEVSVIAMIGFVMLSGIIVNNGIVLIDYMNQLRESGMEKKEAILTAGRTRLRPVFMTALTTILALSTMVFSQAMGAEMMKSMAVVTIGGLVYGTLLTLVVIPCIYDIFMRDKKRVQDEIKHE